MLVLITEWSYRTVPLSSEAFVNSTLKEKLSMVFSSGGASVPIGGGAENKGVVQSTLAVSGSVHNLWGGGSEVGGGGTMRILQFERIFCGSKEYLLPPPPPGQT